MYINLDRYLVFLLIMTRMTGMIIFNPIFGRRNIPTMFTMGLAFSLSIIMYSVLDVPTMASVGFYTFFYLALKELAVGMLAGFIVQLFLSVLVIGGEIIDMELGLSMAKAFDPATNTSVSMTAQLLSAMFYIGFFQSNAHLTLIQMTAKTFDVIPLGELVLNRAVFFEMAELFTLIFLLSVKLCMPMVVMQVVVTFAVGMVMRVVPQINIFVLNIQFKIIIGLLAMVALVPSLSAFCDNLIYICFENIQAIWLGFT